MSERVELVDLRRRHARVAAKVEAGVIEVLRSGRYVGGPQVTELESRVAARMGCTQGVGVGSGTDGLRLALQALNVGPGDEVIVPALSFFATAGAVLELGAVPVVVDVLEDRPLMDAEAAAAAISPKTRAVVPVHLFGNAATLPALGVPILVDAAQAMGASPSLPTGDVAVLSFYPTKVLGGAGDGGMVLTDDAELASRVRELGSHGGHAHRTAGTNSRLDAVQAAVLLAHLTTLAERVARRQAIAVQLDRAASGRALPRDPGSPVTVWALRHPDRDGLAGACESAGIASRVYYPAPLSDALAMAGRCRVPGPLPHAVASCEEVLALPCHADLTEAEVARICQVLEDWA